MRINTKNSLKLVQILKMSSSIDHNEFKKLWNILTKINTFNFDLILNLNLI